MTRSRRAHASMILSSGLIATSFPVVAGIAGALDSAVLTLLRFTLASVLFVPLVALQHRGQVNPGRRGLLRYALLSAPLVGFFYAMFEALRTTTAVNTGALFTFGPAFSALFAFLLTGDRLGRRRTASFGLYNVLIQRLHRGEPVAVMTFWTLVTGTGWLLLLGVGGLAAVRWAEIELSVIGGIVYLAFFTTLVTFLLAQFAVTAIGPTKTVAYTYLNPSLVAMLAWILGDGPIGWMALPGVALTLVSMAVLQRTPGR
jgi:drug/metabolite transporter (DMT)-like permease